MRSVVAGLSLSPRHSGSLEVLSRHLDTCGLAREASIGVLCTEVIVCVWIKGKAETEEKRVTDGSFGTTHIWVGWAKWKQVGRESKSRAQREAVRGY